MRDYEFTVFFYGSCVTVYASGEAEAKILAQAERIKAGLTWDVEGIVKSEEES